MRKNILITGASSGIGEAAAKYLYKNNYNVICLGRDTRKLEQLSSELKNTICIAYDFNDLYNIETIFEQIKANDIKLDGLVHCAGVAPLMKIQDNDIDLMLKTFNTNLFSFIELCKYFSTEKYSNSNSSIVAISSVTARVASYRQAIYTSTKAALEEAVRCMSKEFMERKIRVNCIAPGIVETNMFKELEKQSVTLREKTEKLCPLGLIQPDNIAEIIEFVLSEKAKYMTGSTIIADSEFLSWK